jgi:MFS family permease
VVSLAQAAVAVALAFTASPAAVLALATLLGVGFALSQAAEFTLVPAVVGGDRLRQANGHVETSRYLGFTLGPLAGSVLAATGGTEIAMLVNAATFVAVAVAAVALGTRRPPRPRTQDAPEPRARDGVVLLFRDRTLALAMAVAFVSLLFISASIPADLVYIEDVLGIDDSASGPS